VSSKAFLREHLKKVNQRPSKTTGKPEMHPIDEVLAREGKEQNAEQREYYTTMYQELHSDLREKILTWYKPMLPSSSASLFAQS